MLAEWQNVSTFGFALFAPGSTILCLDIFPAKRGLASSLQGFAITLVFSLVSATVAPLVFASGPRHAIVMAAMLALNWIAWRWYQALV
jgi:DHA1 family bicyclomycin/chloramphenicol resistance-like MFS transporter